MKRRSSGTSSMTLNSSLSVPAIPASRNIALDYLAARSVAEQFAVLESVRGLPAQEIPDDIRRNYHYAVSFEHPALTEMVSRVQALLPANAFAPTNGAFVGVEGPVKSGKTRTVLTAVMQLFHEDILRTDPGSDTPGIISEHIPVVWVVAGKGGPLDLMKGICRFIGIPYNNATSTDLLGIAAQQMERAKTKLLVIDDLHTMRRGSGAEGVNFLRMLLNESPATPVFIAHDFLTHTPIFVNEGLHEPATRQVLERMSRVHVMPADLNREGATMWTRALKMAVKELKLLNKPDPKELQRCAQWLHSELSGHYGSLFEVIAHTAANAVGTCEAVTLQGVKEARRTLAGDPLPPHMRSVGA